MSKRTPKDRPAPCLKLSEDWLAVIIGVAVILIVILFGITSIPWPLFGVL